MTLPCLTLTSLGGTPLNPAGAEYTTFLQPTQMRVQTAPRELQVVKRSGMGPSYQGSMLGERVLMVRHFIAGDGTTHETNLRKLKQEHYSTTFGSRTLIYVDTDAVSKQVLVVAARILPTAATAEQGVVDAEWTLLDPVAYDSSASTTAAVAKNASPATLAVANQGNEYSRQWTLTLKPTTAKTAANGQRYRIKVTPINRCPRPLIQWPVDLTDTFSGGAAAWDHAAEVTATRSQADGDDVEIYVNGRRVDRWAWPSGTGVWNAAATNIWCNLDMPPERHWTYRGNAVLGAGDLTMRVQEDLVNMPRTPFYAAFVTANEATIEVVRVTGYDEDAKTLTIVRAQRGTSATTWANGLYLYWTPVLIDILYGGTSLASPFTDDRYKPMILQTAGAALSDNSVFYWAEFMETSEAALVNARLPRSAAWRPRAVSPDFMREDQFWNYIPRTATLSTDAAVATKMCLAYRVDGAMVGHPICDCWEFTSPIGMTEITHTYVATTLSFTSVDPEGQLQVVGIDGDGNAEVIDSYDAANATETDTPTGNVYAWRFQVDPWDPKKDSTTVELVAQEPAAADGVTIDDVHTHFDADEMILLTWSVKGDAYQFGRPGAPATIANSDGTTIELNGTIVDLNETLSIDMDAGTAVLSGDSTMVGQTISGSFPKLPPGTNNLTFTEAGIGTVEIGVSSKRGAWV